MTSLGFLRIFSLLLDLRAMAYKKSSDDNPYKGQELRKEEKDILRLMANDLDTEAIRQCLFLSKSKHEKLVRLIKQKLDVCNLVAAYRAARDRKSL